ncbi:hypothetical protein V2O64_17395 [Verrucomicrobiaceae bacterium 227]
MKKKIIITLIGLTVIFSLAYFVPILLAKSQAEPLYGNFDIGNRCPDGHEIFLLLEENDSSRYCPGHRDKSEFLKIERTKDEVILLESDSLTPVARISYDGSTHYVTSLTSDRSSEELKQVVSPWRLWLPTKFPE